MARTKDNPTVSADVRIISVAGLEALIGALAAHGHRVVGPTIRDGALVLDELDGIARLPLGWIDEQDAGRYRLKHAEAAGYFDVTHGAQSWKKYLFPPEEKLFSARKTEKGLRIRDETKIGQYAFIGVRACELAAMNVQDRVFMGGDFVATGYAARRQAAFILAVNCRRAGGGCFCVSMETGPRIRDGFDLALSELTGTDGHEFLVEIGSARGREILAAIDTRPAPAAKREAAERASAAAAAAMGRKMPKKARALLAENQRHDHWQDVAKRCLNCANCTLVCPTCFCHSVHDETSLDGNIAERWRRWDSCFTLDFSYIHGGAIRRDGAHRYRHWITHKLSHWHDQFGTSGCVGCGRCISWCPVGIDITEEVRAFAKTPPEKGKGAEARKKASAKVK